MKRHLHRDTFACDRGGGKRMWIRWTTHRAERAVNRVAASVVDDLIDSLGESHVNLSMWTKSPIQLECSICCEVLVAKDRSTEMWVCCSVVSFHLSSCSAWHFNCVVPFNVRLCQVAQANMRSVWVGGRTKEKRRTNLPSEPCSAYCFIQ